jgi:tetratricopeptide (TPR) repeat protein
MRFDDAEHFLSLGLERASTEGLPFASMALLNARGWALYQRAAVLGTESADASAVFRELTGLASSHRHRRFEIDGWAGVGQCAILRSDCDEAERALARLRGSITADARDHAAARCALLNACLLHRRGDWDGALAGYDVALGRAREARLPAREADALVGRGAVQWHLGHRDEAECDWGDASSVAQTCAPVRRQLVQQSILRCRKDRFATPL